MSWNCGCDVLDVIWSNCQIWKNCQKIQTWYGVSNKSRFHHRVSKRGATAVQSHRNLRSHGKKGGRQWRKFHIRKVFAVRSLSVIGVRAAPSLVPASGVRRGSRDGVWGWWWGGWVRCRSLSSVVRRGYDDSKNSKNFTLP